jgi:heme/copper-type cytochrome/quinol oxidase subunit 2
VTPFEIFFDLVFVFALIQVTSFMAKPPTFPILAQGLVVLVLLWFSFVAFTWVGNQVRLDVGLVRAGMFVTMAAIFVAALVIPALGGTAVRTRAERSRWRRPTSWYGHCTPPSTTTGRPEICVCAFRYSCSPSRPRWPRYR